MKTEESIQEQCLSWMYIDIYRHRCTHTRYSIHPVPRRGLLSLLTWSPQHLFAPSNKSKYCFWSCLLSGEHVFSAWLLPLSFLDCRPHDKKIKDKDLYLHVGFKHKAKACFAHQNTLLPVQLFWQKPCWESKHSDRWWDSWAHDQA